MPRVIPFEMLNDAEPVKIDPTLLFLDVDVIPRKGEYFSYKGAMYRVLIVQHDLVQNVTAVIGVMSDAHPEGKAD